ncbi:MAG: DUF2220 domain-containing protein [Tepidibacter sp.]|uniref:Wadjet anti-phage system protein JetD domain-containing protein n=1 Tax=Tepidibacter sp. TaxID=2529387 RepID=UPI0026010098|nr:Wadjet anti-phage system protein JetD domain-containing protein [Tepidibacter sp.]MCT4509725.1 DUF2220 domain-containing protein [Tepidibacter sp.]MCT4584786.1 DUF2220 domain-containing protein [Peptostreptococcaceae bacterium]
MIKIKNIYDFKKKIVSVNEIQEYFKIQDYIELVNFIKDLTQGGKLKEVKTSKLNGMNPALFNKYRILTKGVDNTKYIDEINYSFYFTFNKDYYLSNIDKYKKDRSYIEKLTNYFRNYSERLDIPMAINERSYDIFSEEKFLKYEGGLRILKNLGISLESINIYTTPEPFVYFSKNKDNNQDVLIIENKDTWYTLRKLMIENQNTFLGASFSTIIYGQGKCIEKSLEEYEFTVEKYLFNPNKLIYWGDIDYEGIGIYERLKEKYETKFKIELFRQAYKEMVKKSKKIDLNFSKDKQNKNIKGIFYDELKDIEADIKNILERGEYIPQEILNYQILRIGANESV